MNIYIFQVYIFLLKSISSLGYFSILSNRSTLLFLKFQHYTLFFFDNQLNLNPYFITYPKSAFSPSLNPLSKPPIYPQILPWAV